MTRDLSFCQCFNKYDDFYFIFFWGVGGWWHSIGIKVGGGEGYCHSLGTNELYRLYWDGSVATQSYGRGM